MPMTDEKIGEFHFELLNAAGQKPRTKGHGIHLMMLDSETTSTFCPTQPKEDVTFQFVSFTDSDGKVTRFDSRQVWRARA